MELEVYLFSCLYFYLPAAMANIGANLGKFIPVFKSIKKPVDFGLQINGNRVIGDHKNIGGFLFGVVFGTLFGLIKILYFDNLIPENYLLFKISNSENVILYFLMSFAALFGDIAKSFFKRILNRPPHSPWIPFDEIDHSLFSVLVASFIVPLTLLDGLVIIFMFMILHLATNVIGYFLKIKNVPY